MTTNKMSKMLLVYLPSNSAVPNTRRDQLAIAITIDEKARIPGSDFTTDTPSEEQTH